MALTKFIIPPDQQGYGFQDGIETLHVELDGGASRFRQDILNAAYKVNVSWVLNAIEYTYARNFYRAITKSGSLPFLIDLYTDLGDELLEHEGHFIPGSFGLRAQRGGSFTVSAVIEVKPYTPSETDADMVYLVNEFGWDYLTEIDKLDPIVNLYLPEDLPYV
jgi:hypothetical protein